MRNFMAEFWSKVDIGGSDACWRWKASTNPKGYGQFKPSVMLPCRLSHRVAWEVTYGAIPAGMCVLHRCDVPSCVNPAHLFLGTKADNNADMMAKCRHARGETNGQSKLTRETAMAIRKSDGPHAVVAKRFGVHQSTVTRIKAGAIWAEERVW